MNYPIESYSWKVLSANVAVKHMDKSAFLHHGTGIPKNITFFFGLSPDGIEEPRPLTLIYGSQKFAAHIQMDTQHSRYRLFWKSDLSGTIESIFPDILHGYSSGTHALTEQPLMRFEKLTNNQYMLSLILQDVIKADIEGEAQEEIPSRLEGSTKEYYGKRYERDPANRRDAIAYHGLRCAACGFSFEETYGVLGAGFIEIHHNKPLAAAGQPQTIDPKIDLIPLCANCHRMIHRSRSTVLSVEELKKIVSPNSALDCTT